MFVRRCRPGRQSGRRHWPPRPRIAAWRSGFAYALLVLLLGVVRDLAQPELHGIDLGLLIDEDLLSQPAHYRVFAVAELRLRHIDRPLVVGYHHGREIVVDVT